MKMSRATLTTMFVILFSGLVSAQASYISPSTAISLGSESAELFTKVEFSSLDNLRVTADLYDRGDKKKPLIILFHQSGSSRGEYREIAPELVKLGFNCLAVDLRWGLKDRKNNIENETALRYGTPAIFEQASKGQREKVWPTIFESRKDMVAAIRWARQNGYSGKLIIWGASFSAILVFEIANEHSKEVDGVISYSPGEYHEERPEMVRTWAGALKQDCYIASGVEEIKIARPIFDAIPHEKKVFFHASKGRHGSSILTEDLSNWDELKNFLKRYIV